MAQIHIARQKLVADPIHTVIDIAPFLPVINTRVFQALANKLQLGTTSLVFPSARHTRQGHSFGSAESAKIIANLLAKHEMITVEERDAIIMYALIHDIGHGAFSHVTEDFCKYNNDKMTLIFLRDELREIIDTCGVNSSLVEDLASHKNPLYKVVHDKNLGAEKLDYLHRDGLATIQQKPPGLERLRKYIYFVDGKVVIDERAVENAVGVIDFYATMYRTVYFGKGCVIAQRMFEKNVHALIKADDFDPEFLPYLTDSELLAYMFFSKDQVVQFLYECFRERNLFGEAIVIRPKGFTDETNVSNKNICVIEASSVEMEILSNRKSLQKKSYDSLWNLEESIARLAGIPEGRVIVVPIFNPERFKVQDISIYGKGKLHSLRERRQEKFASIEANATLHAAFRICAQDEYRKILSDPGLAQDVYDLILSHNPN